MTSFDKYGRKLPETYGKPPEAFSPPVKKEEPKAAEPKKVADAPKPKAAKAKAEVKPKAEKHKTKVEEVKLKKGFATAYGDESFVATCSCDWKSDARSTEERAQLEADLHVAEKEGDDG